MNKSITAGFIGMALVSSAAFSDPVENIDAHRHGNLAAAQHYVVQAYEKINAAQQANEYDLAGHAKHAKELLDQASAELKEAALASNEHGH
jgi:cellobiose-specific phosphotransferase system component IIA